MSQQFDVPDAVAVTLDAVTKGDIAGVSSALASLARDARDLPADWLSINADAVGRGDFDLLSDPFIARRFVGDNGKFFIVGPYTVRRPSGELTRLSAVYGEVLPHTPLTGVIAELENIQRAPLQQLFQPLLPVRRVGGCGNFASDQGDAFIVADGWAWRDSVRGPALNDMTLQDSRFDNVIAKCIERVFDADSAAFLLDQLPPGAGGFAVRVRSYEIHEAGHVSGIGLARKVNDNLLPSYWHRAVEEWRADGIGFELGARLLDEKAAAADLASNLCIRFGMDIPRCTGVDSGTEHIGCGLLILDGMFRSGGIRIKDGRLSLRDLTPRGLIHAMETHRHDAIELTRRELELDHPRGVLRLYGQIPVHPATSAVLQGMVVDACRDLVVHFT
jgi:hypothetical protein